MLIEFHIDRTLANMRVWRMGWLLATLSMLVTAIGVILFCADPFAADSLLPPCLFHAVAGLYCPGCGVTRALHALLHGDVVLALAMNPLAIVAIPAVPVMLWNASRPGTAWMATVSDARLWLPLVVAFSVLRNLPWEPFVWLAPG